MNIADDIRSFLNITEWSIKDLADAAGVTPQSISQYLNRRYSTSSTTDKLIPILYGSSRLSKERLKSMNKAVLKQKRVEALQNLVAVN